VRTTTEWSGPWGRSPSPWSWSSTIFTWPVRGSTAACWAAWEFLAYVAEEVLAGCPAALSDFLLRATTRDRIDPQLAVDLAGDASGALLLEECLQQGFFLEEDRSTTDAERYSWQPLFALACRTLLSHRDPGLARALHGAAARHYQDVDVPICVSEALLGDELRTAMTSIGEHWLEVLMTEGAVCLERLCLRLPFPWSEDPEILQVRSACRAIEGDQSYAALLGRRASSGLGALGTARRRRLAVNRALFELFVLGHGDRETAAREGYRLIELATRHPAATLTNGLFLLAGTRPGRSVPGRRPPTCCERPPRPAGPMDSPRSRSAPEKSSPWPCPSRATSRPPRDSARR
jgi:LuxR family transcriptional regulator, maltose regulon positive regulatory protein